MIDLRSDALIPLSPEQRRAAAAAELGDDFYGENGLTKQFEEEIAGLLGKEAALLVPTGTFGNALAILVMVLRPDHLLVERKSHLFRRELGPLSLLAGMSPLVTSSASGLPDPAEVTQWLRSLEAPAEGVVCLENTHLGVGGVAYDQRATTGVVAAVQRSHAKIHLDGARLFHAAAAVGCPVADLAGIADSVMISLVKGLAIPAGAMLAGPADLIAAARERRLALGAAIRWTGWISAMGLACLRQGFAHLTEDIAKARKLADFCRQLGLAPLSRGLATNMVLFDPAPFGHTAEAFAALAQSRGLLVSLINPALVRLAASSKVTWAEISVAEEILGALASGH